MSVFLTVIPFPEVDRSKELLFLGRWDPNEFVLPFIQVTSEWIAPRTIPRAMAEHAEVWSKTAAKDVRRWLDEMALFPVSVYPGETPHTVIAYTDLTGHLEELTDIYLIRDEDSLGLSFGFTHWDFVSLDSRAILQCLKGTELWLPSSLRAAKPEPPKNSFRHLFEERKPKPVVPDFELWQVRQILNSFGGAQMVRVQRISRIYYTGEKNHLGTDRFLGSLSLQRRDYLRVDSHVWVLKTTGIRKQDMFVNR